MIDITWDNIDEAFAELEAECTEVVRGITVMTWNSILVKTPQYDGRMAASWSYSLNIPQYEDRSKEVEFVGPRKIEIGKLQPSQGLYRGHPVALQVANNANRSSDAAFKLGDTVWISNGVNHGEGPYSQDVEDGNIRLRAQNLPGQPVRRTLDMIGLRFDEDVSPRRALTLKTLRVGQGNADAGS